MALLAAVMDLYSRRIVGWAMKDHLRTELPLAALRNGHLDAAVWRRPDPPFRSGRSICLGVPVMQSAGFQASMSRRADCYHNAPMESFFHTLKTELVHHRKYATPAEATRDILPTLRASTPEPVVTPASAISARSRWS
jgi:transposase InsO family protein